MHKFNSYQESYSVIEKEALALIWALQYFNVYVGGGGSNYCLYRSQQVDFSAFVAEPKSAIDEVGFVFANL